MAAALSPRVNATGQEAVLNSFTSEADGAYPYAGLEAYPVGNLYATWAGREVVACPSPTRSSAHNHVAVKGNRR